MEAATNKNGRRWLMSCMLTSVLFVVGLVLAWLWIYNHKYANLLPDGVPAPKCTIRWLTPEERVKESRRTIRGFPPPPMDQKDNPLLYSEWFAVLRFENKGSAPLTVYDIHVGGGKRLRDAFIVDVEVRAPTPDLVPTKPEFTNIHSILPPTVPSQSRLLADPPPTLTFAPGDGVDLQVSILGNWHVADWLKPGVYTTRFTISYAMAPTGEKREITTEPVKVTVTEDNIKAAKEYWAKN